MDVDVVEDGGDVSIEVNTSALGQTATVNGVMSSNASVADAEKEDVGGGADAPLTNGIKTTDTPPADGGYVPVAQPMQPSPLTPPQCNGSVGHGPPDALNDGGIPWYLKGFHLKGTSASEETLSGREAVRSLSEDLTDMDDEELNGLEFDVEDSTITASPMDTSKGPAAAPSKLPVRHSNGKFRRKDEVVPAVPAVPAVRSSTRKR